MARGRLHVARVLVPFTNSLGVVSCRPEVSQRQSIPRLQHWFPCQPFLYIRKHFGHSCPSHWCLRRHSRTPLQYRGSANAFLQPRKQHARRCTTLSVLCQRLHTGPQRRTPRKCCYYHCLRQRQNNYRHIAEALYQRQVLLGKVTSRLLSSSSKSFPSCNRYRCQASHRFRSRHAVVLERLSTWLCSTRFLKRKSRCRINYPIIRAHVLVLGVSNSFSRRLLEVAQNHHYTLSHNKLRRENGPVVVGYVPMSLRHVVKTATEGVRDREHKNIRKHPPVKAGRDRQSQAPVD